jgi:hypothetical protein
VSVGTFAPCPQNGRATCSLHVLACRLFDRLHHAQSVAGNRGLFTRPCRLHGRRWDRHQ